MAETIDLNNPALKQAKRDVEQGEGIFYAFEEVDTEQLAKDGMPELAEKIKRFMALASELCKDVGVVDQE